MKLSVKNFSSHKWEWITVFLILCIALFLRMYKIRDYLTFLGDEGRDVLIVYGILHGHITLLGPTSSVGGFFLGPIYYYFMAPFLFLFHYDPVGPAVMIALFGVFTVWLIYSIGKSFFNTMTGVIAALLYTVSPLVITYSRSSWNPNLMPVCTLLLLFTLYQAVKKNSWKLYILTGILFGIAMQLHYLAVFIGVTVSIYIFTMTWYQMKIRKESLQNFFRRLVKGNGNFLLGFIIGWLPFLGFEIRHGFTNIRGIISFIFASRDAGVSSGFSVGNVGDVFFRLFARLIINMPSPDLYQVYRVWQLDTWEVSAWILGILAIFCLTTLVWKTIHKEEKFLQYSLLLCWLICGVSFFGLYHKSIYDYYLEFLFPLPFFLVGFLFSFIWRKNVLSKVITYLLLTVFILVNLTGVPFRYAPNRQLMQTEIISHAILQMTDGKAYNFALISKGNSDQAYRYFLTIWGHPPVIIQNASVDPKRQTVTNQLIVVCENIPCGPLGYSLWEIAGFGRADIAGKKHVIVVDIYRLVHYKGK